MSQWRKAGPNEAFTPEEIDARLKAELPKWYYEDGWIRRKYKTN
ncbi:MAG: 4a-hydroxytetrahydrobiopterin dehydratase, partial [Methyloversatilis sp.]|nr:4a-hydroxytetrahydrobiopterin dehydratase [Methyloversatilis sp.]